MFPFEGSLRWLLGEGVPIRRFERRERGLRGSQRIRVPLILVGSMTLQQIAARFLLVQLADEMVDLRLAECCVGFGSWSRVEQQFALATDGRAHFLDERVDGFFAGRQCLRGSSCGSFGSGALLL